MPITVQCPCGRAYTKPDHKAGQRFRCHVCGREVTVTGATPPPAVARPAQQASPKSGAADPPDGEVPDDAMIQPSKPPRRSAARNTVAWIVIVIGLCATVGGGGMIYIYAIASRSQAESAQAQSNMIGPGQVVYQPRDEGPEFVLVAVFSIVVGLVITFVGFRLRVHAGDDQPLRRRKRRKRANID